MSNRKAVYRKFEIGTWDDERFEDFDIYQKILFIYLWTNPKCNKAGVYELKLKRITYHTSIPEEQIIPLIEKMHPMIMLSADKKVVWIKNFLDIQCSNKDFAKSAIKIVKEQFPEFYNEYIEYNMLKFQELSLDPPLRVVTPPLDPPLRVVTPPLDPPLRGQGEPSDGSSVKQLSSSTVDAPVVPKGTENDSNSLFEQEAEKPPKKTKADLIYDLYPRKVGAKEAKKQIDLALKKVPFEHLERAVQEYARSELVRTSPQEYIPYPERWFKKERWLDDRSEWHRPYQSRASPGDSRGIGHRMATAESSKGW